MSINLRRTSLVSLATITVGAVFAARCGSTPAAPTGATLAALTLNAAAIAAGSNGQGTVTLTAAAPTGGDTVSLSSSTPAVATVQTPVTIAAGLTSATFTVTAVAVGTTTITAALNGASSQPVTLTVTAAPVALASITLSAPSVIGGGSVTATALLTGNAPAGGATVVLSSADPLTVPPTVVVPAGSPSAMFSVSTRVVNATTAGTINGSYGGGTASAMLSVTAPSVATANFGVTGPTETETCTVTNSGNTLDCTFNGSTSTAPGTITEWDWSWSVPTATQFTKTTASPQLIMPAVNCSLMPPPPLPPGNPWFTMTVTLKIHDSLGNVSAVTTDNGVRLLPQGVCGF